MTVSTVITASRCDRIIPLHGVLSPTTLHVPGNWAGGVNKPRKANSPTGQEWGVIMARELLGRAENKLSLNECKSHCEVSRSSQSTHSREGPSDWREGGLRAPARRQDSVGGEEAVMNWALPERRWELVLEALSGMFRSTIWSVFSELQSVITFTIFARCESCSISSLTSYLIFFKLIYLLLL